MALLTNKESEVLLKLFKDFSQNYNANSISKEIQITPRGALKILKKLEKNNLVKGKQFGKAVFYKPNLQDNYACKIIETILIAESREKVGRWLEEFKGTYKDAEIVIIFGSILRNPKDAKDIDILFVLKKGRYKKINEFNREKDKILTKKIHGIFQTKNDLKENLTCNKAIQDAIRTGYILFGHDKIINILKNVTSI